MWGRRQDRSLWILESLTCGKTLWMLLTGRFLSVTHQQRDNLILKPNSGREKLHFFLLLFFSLIFFPGIFVRHRISPYYSFPCFLEVHCMSSLFSRPTLALTQRIYFLGNEDSLWVITYIFQGLGFHGYIQLRTIPFYLRPKTRGKM